MTRKNKALAHFKRVDPHFYAATKSHHASLPSELPHKRTRAALFEALVRIVVAQQLGTAAADAIFMKVKQACKGRVTPESVLETREAEFRGAGLSSAKIKTIKGLANAVVDNFLDLVKLKKLPESQVHAALSQLWGLGPWSIEMFMMGSLGRDDVFSPGDLGLIRAMEMIYALPKNTPRTSLLLIAEKWSPYRSYASLLLWRTKDDNAKNFRSRSLR